MKSAILAMIAIVMFISPLCALGYTSAFVEAKQDYEASIGLKAPGEEKVPNYMNPSSYTLANPGLNPMTDTASRLAYGLMDAILLRFKQQLFISAVSQWRDELVRSDISLLFPNLTSLLSRVDAHNFMSSYDLWRSAIDRDLQETPLGMMSYSVAMMERYTVIDPQKLFALAEMRDLLQDFYSLRQVSNLHDFVQITTTTDEIHSQFFKAIGITAKNMMNEAGEFDLNGLKEFTADPRAIPFYLARLQTDLNGIRIAGDSLLVTAENFKYYIESCYTVESFFDELNTPSPASVPKEKQQSQLLRLYLGTCDKLLVQWSKLSASSQSSWDGYYREFTRYRMRVGDISAMSENRDYQGLLQKLAVTATELVPAKVAQADNYNRFLNVITALLPAEEQTTVSYRDIMNSVLEPVGSYSYKRSSELTVAFSAYPGIGFGAETLTRKWQDAQSVGGLACPVGLELNWGKKLPLISGIFVPAFDLGAIATYRFSKDDADVSNAPQIGWDQLSSPGLYLLSQSQAHPFTLGLGVQMTPKLRKVTEAGIEEAKDAIRAGIFLSMDISLFTLYVKHRWLKTSAPPQKQSNAQQAND